MFRNCLHPDRLGLVGGIVVIALWALLWAWFLFGIARGPERQVREARSAPELSRAITFETSLAG